MLERDYQAYLIRKIGDLFPGVFIMKNDTDYIQGVPDLTLLFPRGGWAVLEVKAYFGAPEQPNQEYYINTLNDMGFAAFIYPENEEEVLDALQRSFQTRRNARASQR